MRARSRRAAAFVVVVLACAHGALALAESGSKEKSNATDDYDWVPILEPEATDFPPPPDGKWLVDENGKEYTLFRWRKYPGYYQWVDEEKGLVKLRHLMVMQVEYHDDEFLYFRHYNPARFDEDRAARRRAQEEKLAELAKTYRTEIEEQDRLRLEPWDDGLPQNYQWRNGFAIADMNGDGHLDIVHGPPRKGPTTYPVIFLGNGAGSWRLWEEARFPLLPYDYGDVAVGDLDGDGYLDIVLGAHLTGIMALRGDGKGGFESWSEGLPLRRSARLRLEEMKKALEASKSGRAEAPRRARRPRPNARATQSEQLPQLGPDGQPLEPPPEPPAFTSRALALADWNRDGRLDILAISEGPTSVKDIVDGVATPTGKVIFLNQGDGSWETLTGPGELLGDAVVPVDLDRDGRVDFVTDSDRVGSGQLVNRSAGESWEVLGIEARRRLLVHGIAVDDFDGDGRLDLALAFQSQELEKPSKGIDIYFGVDPAKSVGPADGVEPGVATPAGPLAWRRASVYATDEFETEGIRRIAAGDLDGDGDSDLVTLTAEGKVWIFLNDGDRGFVREASPEADPDPEHLYCAGYDAEIVDLDGDGRQELVAAFAGESGSELLVGQEPRCRAEGALRVFKVVAAVPAQEPTAASPVPGVR